MLRHFGYCDNWWHYGSRSSLNSSDDCSFVIKAINHNTRRTAWVITNEISRDWYWSMWNLVTHCLPHAENTKKTYHKWNALSKISLHILAAHYKLKHTNICTVVNTALCNIFSTLMQKRQLCERYSFQQFISSTKSLIYTSEQIPCYHNPSRGGLSIYITVTS